jgi:nucleoside-diphosphate-sugar epimerase
MNASTVLEVTSTPDHPVVVTGASGFIGRRLVQVLASNGMAGLAVSRTAVTSLPDGWTYLPRDRFLNEATPRPVRAIIHLEARHHVFRQTPESIAEMEQVNVGGTAAMLQAADRYQCPAFLYFSSIKAVDPGLGQTDELAPGPGRTLYGRTKWQAESLVRQWVSAHPTRSARILRPAVVYGPGNTANLYSMMDAVARGRFPLVAGGKNVKSIVSLENVCASVVHLLARLQPGTEVFNLAEPESFPVHVLGQQMARALGVAAPTRSIPLGLARLLAWIGDGIMAAGVQGFPMNSTRLEGLVENSHFSARKLLETGFTPVESTKDGIQRLADWYAKQSSAPRKT